MQNDGRQKTAPPLAFSGGIGYDTKESYTNQEVNGNERRIITLTDEDGNDIELEYVDALEDNGQTYMAFFPTVDDETDEAAAEDFGLVILKSVMENGEELLTTLDSDQELQRVYDLFMEQLMDEDDENS